ncbi:MAG: sodium:alanine symporter family protein [Bacteroidales bacterium]
MELFTHTVAEVGAFLWGFPMVILLLGTHLFLTFRLRFPQRHIFKAIKLSLQRDSGSGDISPFGSLVTALASTIGTGNIIGVSTAIALGGPGAVFWCWVTGLFGIATRYAESLLAVKYRVKTEDGSMIGGAMYMLERGLNMKWLGVLFAIFTVIASFGIGNTVQTNSISTLLYSTIGIETYITGAVLAILIGLVILFGIKGIANTCSILVPFMAIFYIVGCIIILIVNRAALGETIQLILSSAFDFNSVAGGFAGSGIMLAMRYGVSRGLFSNEAGLGSAPIIAAAAKTSNPVRQALISSTSVFWDTVIVCALTGLVIVSSVIIHPDINYTDGALMTKQAFSKLPFGSIFLSVALISFTFSTILGWTYYSEKCIEYLGSKKSIIYFRIVWVITIYIGSTMNLELIWGIADITNALMSIPNIIAILLLSAVAAKTSKEYLDNNKLL